MGSPLKIHRRGLVSHWLGSRLAVIDHDRSSWKLGSYIIAPEQVGTD